MHRMKFLALVVALAAAGCTGSVDLKQALQVTDLSSGWRDGGIVDGKNKIVPSVTFTLKKTPGTEVSSVALNAVIRRADGQSSDLDDDIYVQRVDFNGDQTAPITITGTAGYTGEPPQGRADLLRNALFGDVRITIFAKQSSSQWVELAQTVVTRQLVTR